MEYVTIYKLYVEIKPCNQTEETQLHLVGSFKDDVDAEYAANLYEVAFNKTHDSNSDQIKCTGNYKINKVISKFGPNYDSLNEFIKRNSIVRPYSRKIGDYATKNLIVSIDQKIKSKRNFRIIDRMIRDYHYQIMLDEKNPQMHDTVEHYKENIKFLQDLRDGKI